MLRRVFQHFLCLEIPVNQTEYRRAAGSFNNGNLSFNYKLHFKGCKNRMAISHADLKRQNCSITNNIQIFLILVSVFVSLSSTIPQDNFPPYIFVSTSILVALYLWSRSNFLLSILLLRSDVEMNQGSKLISKESFSIFHWNLNSTNLTTILKYPFLKHI